MDLTRIRYFLELSATLNFSNAADRLGISQPALTKAIARLESEVGGKLLRREGKYTHLTALGEGMREQFVDIDVAVKRAESLAHRHQRRSLAQLRIGVASGVGPRRAALFLVRFLERYPETRIKLEDVSNGALAESMLNGEIDCAFTVNESSNHGKLNDERLHVLDLYSEPLVLIGGPAQHGSEASLAACPAPNVGRIVWETNGGAADMDDEVQSRRLPSVSSTRDDWTQALVLAGLGPAVVPLDAVLSSEIKDGIKATDGPARSISLVIPAGRVDTSEVQQFVAMIKQYNWDAKSA